MAARPFLLEAAPADDASRSSDATTSQYTPMRRDSACSDAAPHTQDPVAMTSHEKADFPTFGKVAALFKTKPSRIDILFIVVTAVGPFVQQIISLGYLTHNMGNGTLPIATVPLGLTSSSPPDPPSLAALALASQADTKFDIASTCPPDTNCTWDAYETLMVKNECQDITRDLEHEYPCVSIGVGNLQCIVPGNCSTGSDGSTTDCTSFPFSVKYSLPGGASVNQTYTLTWVPGSLESLSSGPNKPSYNLITVRPLSASTAFKDKGNVLWDFQSVHMTQARPASMTENITVLTPNSTKPLTLPASATNVPVDLEFNISSAAMAIECSVRLVGQKMKATFINNNFTETTIGPYVENNTAIAQEITRPVGNVNGCISFESFNGTAPPLLACYTPTNTPNSLAILTVLAQRLSSTFEDHSDYFSLINLDVGSDGPERVVNRDNRHMNVARYTPQNTSDLNTIYQTIDAAMGNVGRIMSQFVRQYQVQVPYDSFTVWDTELKPALNATYGSMQPPFVASGIATKQVLVYKIIWGWIALPASLVAMLGLLILLTAIDTRRRGVPPWGREQLANVIHGADEATRHLLANAEEQGELDEVAEQTRVQLALEQVGSSDQMTVPSPSPWAVQDAIGSVGNSIAAGSRDKSPIGIANARRATS
ncbi:hypothetical protein F4808DRAFT_467601 [Astrocystis sublimbata]|nr:hypothetical protein F4808DRAFT_467601 [Astrocystis sublimbata]